MAYITNETDFVVTTAAAQSQAAASATVVAELSDALRRMLLTSALVEDINSAEAKAAAREARVFAISALNRARPYARHEHHG